MISNLKSVAFDNQLNSEFQKCNSSENTREEHASTSTRLRNIYRWKKVLALAAGKSFKTVFHGVFAANLLQWGEKEYHLLFAYCTIEETQQLRTLNDLTQNSLELIFYMWALVAN